MHQNQSFDQVAGQGRLSLAEVLNPDGSVDRKSTRLNSSHLGISYAVFCLKKKKEWNEKVQEHHIPVSSFHFEGMHPDEHALFFLFFSRPRAFTRFPSRPLFR